LKGLTVYEVFQTVRAFSLHPSVNPRNSCLTVKDFLFSIFQHFSLVPCHPLRQAPTPDKALIRNPLRGRSPLQVGGPSLFQGYSLTKLPCWSRQSFQLFPGCDFPFRNGVKPVLCLLRISQLASSSFFNPFFSPGFSSLPLYILNLPFFFTPPQGLTPHISLLISPSPLFERH